MKKALLTAALFFVTACTILAPAQATELNHPIYVSPSLAPLNITNDNAVMTSATVEVRALYDHQTFLFHANQVFVENWPMVARIQPHPKLKSTRLIGEANAPGNVVSLATRQHNTNQTAFEKVGWQVRLAA